MSNAFKPALTALAALGERATHLAFFDDECEMLTQCTDDLTPLLRRLFRVTQTKTLSSEERAAIGIDLCEALQDALTTVMKASSKDAQPSDLAQCFNLARDKISRSLDAIAAGATVRACGFSPPLRDISKRIAKLVAVHTEKKDALSDEFATRLAAHLGMDLEEVTRTCGDLLKQLTAQEAAEKEKGKGKEKVKEEEEEDEEEEAEYQRLHTTRSKSRPLTLETAYMRSPYYGDASEAVYGKVDGSVRRSASNAVNPFKPSPSPLATVSEPTTPRPQEQQPAPPVRRASQQHNSHTNPISSSSSSATANGYPQPPSRRPPTAPTEPFSSSSSNAKRSSSSAGQQQKPSPLDLARRCVVRGDFDGAKQACNKLISSDASCAEAYSVRGEAHRMLGNLTAAISDASQCLRLDSSAYIAYRIRAECCRMKDLPDEAIADATMSINLNPAFHMAYFTRAEAYRRKDNFRAAIKDATMCIKIKPKLYASYYIRGECRRNLNELEEALEDYTMAIHYNTQCSEAFLARALVFNSRADFDACIADATSALRIDPSLHEAYGIRGSALRRKGETKLAKVDLMRSLELFPEYEFGQRELKKCGRFSRRK